MTKLRTFMLATYPDIYAAQRQRLDLITKPYFDLTDLDRAALVEVVYQRDRFRGWGVALDNCVRYYPQIFTGRWMPLQYSYGGEEDIEEVGAGKFLGIYVGRVVLCPNERPDWSGIGIEWD